MCGIAGIIKFNGECSSLADLMRMTDIISHRGPDGEGHWINEKGNIGFGHRRLSIIDLSDNAKQPMHYADGRYAITFNGEIYNYIELKKDLLQQGYNFTSNSDTEVLMALFDFKQENCLDDLDGMFSFAIWDEQKQELFCARDRFGEKPFHFFSDKDQFVFASEIKQFWAYGISKKISEKRLTEFIVDGSIDELNEPESTFYKDIRRLDAAHYMRIDSRGNIFKQRYWNIDLHKKGYSGTIENAEVEFLYLLTESVRLRLRSDVPVGSSLSGGLDSSSIVMLIDKLKGGDLKQNTFSARFNDFEKDEGKYIEQVVKMCKNLDVHYTWPDSNYFAETLQKICYHQDEPFGSASITAQYAVMELAKKEKITVLLDGQGADEYMAGYITYYKTYLNQLYYHKKKKYSGELRAYNSFHGRTLQYSDLGKTETLRMKIGKYKNRILGQEMPFGTNELRKKLLFDTTSGGLKELLRYADRNSMAHSREVRLPFLCHKLVEFVFSLPDEYILHLGWTKYILRKSMSSILPESICWRKDKIGYEPPQLKWMESAQIANETAQSIKLIQDAIDTSHIDFTDKGKKWGALIGGYYLK